VSAKANASLVGQFAVAAALRRHKAPCFRSGEFTSPLGIVGAALCRHGGVNPPLRHAAPHKPRPRAEETNIRRTVICCDLENFLAPVVQKLVHDFNSEFGMGRQAIAELRSAQARLF
jgi:hypothetical protein